MICRLRLEIEGLVQGVGFRPLVLRLARELELTGWVRNTGAGVLLELQGPAPAIDTLLQRLRRQRPPHSRLDRIRRHQRPLEAAETGFEIQEAPMEEAHGSGRADTSVRWALIQPDLAPCPSCRAELRDPANRRCGYALISCVHCGPRYSLMGTLPFDRVRTGLAAFPLCPACQAEYDDPSDRRCHAQTIACPRCGPRLSWWGPGGQRLSDPRRPHPSGPSPCLQAAAAALMADRTVALKGVGGFQLLVRARCPEAVAGLRRRKGRPEKPLAVMAPGLAWVRRHCHLNPTEARLLDSAAAPIVLLRRRGEAGVCDAVAPDNPWLGVMLPSSPLHLLLLELLDEPLVATSGNRSGEPLCHDETRALQELADLADGFLVHDRPILNPVDDSIAQVVCGEPMLLRHARGYAPTAVDLPSAAEPGVDPPPPLPTGEVAMGGQLKSALAFGWGRRALLGPHLGDLDSAAGEAHLRRSLGDALARHGLRPAGYVVDQHRGYRSHRIGLELAALGGCPPPLGVQHHHAHLLACLAEHGLAPPEVGVAWDGAGQGSDGTLWGGEVLRLEQSGFRAEARLRPFPLPGAERALREPRRAALGLLFAAGGSEELARATGTPTMGAFSAEERQVLSRMLQQGLQSPWCSSVGRLFDAVASLLGLQQRCSFEGQAALKLEAAASHGGTAGRRRYALVLRTHTAPGGGNGNGNGSGPWLLDWHPLLQDLLDDQRRGVAAEAIALAFHHALADALVDLAVRLKLERLLLSGGCFQNRLLLTLAAGGLRRAGIEPLWPRRIPCNDGGLALGQLMAVSLGRSG